MHCSVENVHMVFFHRGSFFGECGHLLLVVLFWYVQVQCRTLCFGVVGGGVWWWHLLVVVFGVGVYRCHYRDAAAAGDWGQDSP